MHSCVFAVALVLFLIQFLASSIFPGTNKGIQLPLNAVSFTAWGYRGLILNEFADDNASWGCPGAINTNPDVQKSTFVLGSDVRLFHAPLYIPVLLCSMGSSLVKGTCDSKCSDTPS